MPRGLTTAQSNAVTSGNTYSSELMVEIYPSGGTNLYYTTGYTDISDANSLTVPSVVTYLSDSKIRVIGNLKESYDPNGNEITIEFATTDNTFADVLNSKLLTTRVVISRNFRNVTTGAVVTNSKITLYDGTATALTVQGGDADHIVQLKCQSVFRNLDSIKSRTTTDIEPFNNKTLVWGTIVWR
jgi:hypothetical protein